MIRALLSVLLLSSVTSALPTHSVGALYTMTNDPSDNAVVINAIYPDGSIRYSRSVPTGGKVSLVSCQARNLASTKFKGLHGHDIPGPNGPDALYSAGPVTVSGNHLFLVNPGSNTVSMFFINPVNPLDIRLVGKPVSTRGEFPVSVDASPKTGDVCVLNSGKVNGVACYKATSRGLKPFGKFYSFGLNETTPSAGPAGTVSHILFSQDGSKVRASVKGIPGSFNGFIASWDVATDGSLSETFTKTSPPPGDGLAVFGMANVVGVPSAVMATDPALGLTIYNFSKPETKFLPLTIPGQSATCWAEYSHVTDSYWLSDLGATAVYEVSVDTKTLNSTLLQTFNLPLGYNVTDVAVASVRGKDYLYVLSPSVSSFNIFSLKKGNSTFAQSYDFGKMVKGVKLDPVNLAGAAVFVT